MKVPFSPQRIDNVVIKEVTEALQSGWITTRTKEKRVLKNALLHIVIFPMWFVSILLLRDWNLFFAGME